MRWYLNDLSIRGQYANPAAFLNEVEDLMRLRRQVQALKDHLFCSRTLYNQPVTRNADFRVAVQSAPDRNLTRLVLEWVTRSGPFLEEDRQPNQDDYFECAGTDVTDMGLGEAARRLVANEVATSFSFGGGGFDYQSINICHGLPQAPIGAVFVPNIWDIAALRTQAIAAIPEPANWQQMLEQAQLRFDRLTLPSTAIAPLAREPFSAYVVERIFVLLGILQEFAASRNANGSYSARNHELIAKHFAGEKDLFTDESETNKRNFREELSFSDAENPGTKVFCPWHGKIKTPQYRIHFEWPLDARPNVRIFYIGPKITKS